MLMMSAIMQPKAKGVRQYSSDTNRIGETHRRDGRSRMERDAGERGFMVLCARLVCKM